MEWFTTVITWYLYLLFIGIVFTPLAKKLFGSFFDFGYPFAKTIGIIVLSYTIFVLGIIKLIPFSRESLFFIIVLYAIFFYRKIVTFTWEDIKKIPKSVFLMIGIEEILFFASLTFLAYVRGHEPSIHGLEKFMDYGFINSILRSSYFPPLDMWYSADPTHPNGYAINYYYFGHLTGALLIKLSNIVPAVGYNLILATIFAQGVTLTFSICSQLVYFFQKHILKRTKLDVLSMILFGLLGSFIVNLGGNLHTIYIFTKGYPNDNPVPFWHIFQTFESVFTTMNESKLNMIDAFIQNSKYWYPNATRFIPFTIHEFPSYSYVVADLHGHVFDIPFVLVTIALIYQFFVNSTQPALIEQTQPEENDSKHQKKNKETTKLPTFLHKNISNPFIYKLALNVWNPKTLTTILFGFLISVHYMTNAFDGPIYILFIAAIFFLLYQFTPMFFVQSFMLVLSFWVFSRPFSLYFEPFASGIGVNCSPQFLTNLKSLGPFMFIEGNCQVSQLYMLFTLWGFFWISALLLLFVLFYPRHKKKDQPTMYNLDFLMLIFFAFGTFLVIVPEFLYAKDIYPAHFRANTMFKMGYQAFIIMGIASTYSLYRIRVWTHKLKYLLKILFFIFFALVAIYPFLAFPSYYPLKKDANFPTTVSLDGSKWIENTSAIAQDKEIIEYINSSIPGQPVILEAQGDSYTDYERISAYTGTPTIAGWWVHEWLWRGDSEVVGKRLPDISAIYESEDIQATRELLKKYNVSYVVISNLEREKYPKINEEKFSGIGNKIFTTKNGSGALYRVN